MKISKSKLNLALARKQWNQRDLRDNAVVSSQTMYQFSCVAPLAFVFFFGAAVMWFSGIR